MHLKRKAMPKSWPLAKKTVERYITKGTGSRPSKTSIPLIVVLRDMLKVLGTRNEAKKILHAGEIYVDNRAIRDEKFRVGLFDRIYIKKIDKFFTLELKNKKMEVVEIKKEEIEKKPAKVTGKRSLNEKTMQISFYDGKNISISAKDALQISVGDSVVIWLKEMKIEKVLKLEKGATVFVIGGKHQGEKGKILSIEPEIVIKNKKEFKVSKQNIFVIEK